MDPTFASLLDGLRSAGQHDHEGVGLPPSRSAQTFQAGWFEATPIVDSLRESNEEIERYHAVLALRTNISARPLVHLVYQGAVVGQIEHLSLPPGLPPGLIGAVAVDRYHSDLSGHHLLDSDFNAIGMEVARNANRLLDLLGRGSGTAFHRAVEDISHR